MKTLYIILISIFIGLCATQTKAEDRFLFFGCFIEDWQNTNTLYVADKEKVKSKFIAVTGDACGLTHGRDNCKWVHTPTGAVVIMAAVDVLGKGYNVNESNLATFLLTLNYPNTWRNMWGSGKQALREKNMVPYKEWLASQ